MPQSKKTIAKKKPTPKAAKAPRPRLKFGIASALRKAARGFKMEREDKQTQLVSDDEGCWYARRKYLDARGSWRFGSWALAYLSESDLNSEWRVVAPSGRARK